MCGFDGSDDDLNLWRMRKTGLRLISPAILELPPPLPLKRARRRWYASKRGWLWLVVGASAFLLLLEVSSQSRRATAPPATASVSHDAAVRRGASLYVEYACVQCHGLGGKGRGDLQPSGPSLVSKDFERAFPLDAAIVDIIRNGSTRERGRPASMPVWNGIVPEDDMRALAAYVRAGLPDAGVPLPPTGTGEEIYSAFACIKCHGLLGVGGIKNVAASDPARQVIPSLGGPEFRRRYGNREEVRRVILNGRAVEGGKLGVVYAPAWGKIGSADQLERLIEYLYSD